MIYYLGEMPDTDGRCNSAVLAGIRYMRGKRFLTTCTCVTDSGPADAASRHTTRRPATLELHPVIHVPNYMDYYSFTDL